MLGCALFRRPYGSRLVSNGAELLSDGVAVLAHGRVGIYEVRGALQLVVDLVRPGYSLIGDLATPLTMRILVILRSDGRVLALTLAATLSVIDWS